MRLTGHHNQRFDDRVIHALTSALDDHEDRIDYCAALSLGNIGDRRAVPALVKVVHGPHVDVLDAALLALGAIGDPSVLPLVQRIVTSQDGRHYGILEPNIRGAVRRAKAEIEAQRAGKRRRLL